MVSPSASTLFRPSAALRTVLFVCGALLGLLPLHAQTAAEIIRFPDLDEARVYTGLDQTVTVDIDPAYAVTVLTYNGSKTKLPRNAGAYTIRVVAKETSPASGKTPRSFARTGKFTIAKAPLTVTANDAARLLGVANPKFTFTYEGFVNGETETAIRAKPSGKTTARPASPVGEYDITPVGGAAANYEFTTRLPGILTVVSFASGTHEALLYSSSLGEPVGKLTLTLPNTGAGFSGKLDVGDDETAAFGFKGVLVLSEDHTRATATATIQRSPKTKPPTTPYRYLIDLTLDDTGGVAVSLLKSESPYSWSVVHAEVDDLGRVGVHKKTSNPATNNPAPWAGTHTLSLLDPAPVLFGFDFPSGIGYASAIIAADGKLALRGKLADGTALTASVASDATGGYRVFQRSYGARLASDFSGFIQLIPHPDLPGRYHSPRDRSSGDGLYWRKAEKTSDKTYPDGIVTLDFGFALDPWLPPSAAKKATRTTEAVPAVTLAQRLFLASDPAANVAFDVGYDLAGYGADEFKLPFDNGAILTAKGKVTHNLETNPTGWKATFNPATGVFTGGFTLRDPEDSPKVRNIAFQGILRQPPSNETAADFGAGFFIIAPLEIDYLHTTPFSQQITFGYPAAF